jgi:hypothetical protein
VAAIQAVVLNDEQDIEQDGEKPKAKLGGVAKDGAPVI